METRPQELPRAMVARAARGCAERLCDGEPDLVTGGGAIDRLKHQLERDAPLHFADDDELWNPIRQADEIAAAHLAFDLQTEPFEMTLDRWVEICFQEKILSSRA